MVRLLDTEVLLRLTAFFFAGAFALAFFFTGDFLAPALAFFFILSLPLNSISDEQHDGTAPRRCRPGLQGKQA